VLYWRHGLARAPLSCALRPNGNSGALQTGTESGYDYSCDELRVSDENRLLRPRRSRCSMSRFRIAEVGARYISIPHWRHGLARAPLSCALRPNGNSGALQTGTAPVALRVGNDEAAFAVEQNVCVDRMRERDREVVPGSPYNPSSSDDKSLGIRFYAAMPIFAPSMPELASFAPCRERRGRVRR
jgi:hypothetical protein